MRLSRLIYFIVINVRIVSYRIAHKFQHNDDDDDFISFYSRMRLQLFCCLYMQCANSIKECNVLRMKILFFSSRASHFERQASAHNCFLPFVFRFSETPDDLYSINNKSEFIQWYLKEIKALPPKRTECQAKNWLYEMWKKMSEFSVLSIKWTVCWTFRSIKQFQLICTRNLSVQWLLIFDSKYSVRLFCLLVFI